MTNRCAVSYRDLEEIMAERGVKVDHVALNRPGGQFALMRERNGCFA
jgi:putative transposase